MDDLDPVMRDAVERIADGRIQTRQRPWVRLDAGESVIVVNEGDSLYTVVAVTWEDLRAAILMGVIPFEYVEEAAHDDRYRVSLDD